MTDRELMQQALDALEESTYNGALKQALRTRLAQPKPEPVAWMHIQGNHEEPCFRELTEDEINRGWRQKPLYITPPQRKWQGLTDEEIKEIVGPWGSLPVDGYTRELFDQIEEALRRKNT